MLKFSQANAKTQGLTLVPAIQPFLANKRKVYSLDLLSGHYCPFAHDCLSKAIVKPDGKRAIQDGPHTKFRCFSASQEVQYNNVYNSRKHNSDVLRALNGCDAIADRLCEDLPSNLGVCRIHVAGDFFNPSYFLGWILTAERNPDRLFYAYTKSLPYWTTYKGELPPNFVLTASYGGRRDDLIESHSLRFAKVVFSEAEAKKLGLAIDHDDSHAADPSKRGESFALLLHGTQPKGSDASTALRALKGKGSYSRKKGGK